MSQNHINIVNYLLSQGADENIPDSHGLTFQDLQNDIFRQDVNKNVNVSDKSKNIEINVNNQQKMLITNQLNGVICPKCLKETFAVVRKKDIYVCMNCGKKKLNLWY